VTAAITGAPASGHSPEGAAVTLGSSVTDPAGQAAGFTYAWAVTKNGSPFATGTSSGITFTPDDTGTYVVTLTVTDNDGGTSAPATATIIADEAPPAVAITGAPPSGAPGTAINLGSSVTGPTSIDQAAGYTYAWSVTKAGSPFASGSSASFSFTPDTAAAYVVTLTATDGEGQAGTATATIGVGVTLPAVPVTITAMAADTQAVLTWAASSGATSYEVYRATAAGGEVGPPVATIAATSAPVMIFTDTGLTDGQTYYWKITASNAAGASAFSVEVSATPYASSSYGLTIPSGHGQRVWWTATSLAQAKAWYAANPYTPGTASWLSAPSVWDSALAYVLTGNTSYGQAAVNAMMNFNIDAYVGTSTGNDYMRWMDYVPTVYDWCHDLMTPAQQQAIIARYNGYLAFYMTWDGDLPADNYFWGAVRNELDWGIATYGENPEASAFLNDAINVRWPAFLNYANTSGQGGLPPEGSQYGPYMLQYSVVPLVSAKNLGLNLYAQTNWYNEAVYGVIAATTQSPTQGYRATDNYYQTFPYGDDDYDYGYVNIASSPITSPDTADFMTAMAMLNPNSAVGQYARQWLNMVNPLRDNYVAAADPGGAALSFSNLPPDYYTGGSMQYFYTRDQWGPSSTEGLFQLGYEVGVDGHTDLNSGSFQIWRDGYWLTRNDIGYGSAIAGWQGATATVGDTIAQNGILYNGMGLANGFWNTPPQTTRLESTSLFDYAAVDLSGAYQSSRPNLANPYEASTVREYFFIKPLDTYLILDRLGSSSAQVTQTFLLHFPNQPTVEAPNVVDGVNGSQELRLTSLSPQQPTFNVVNEADFNGTPDPSAAYQYRLEESQSGQAQSYFINVLQAKGVNDPNVTAQLTDNGTSWTITLTSPTLGTAVLVLNKGMTSAGGSIGYSATGTPTNPTPLIDHVQSMQVTDQGPVWGT
jgi:hypothetical protein